MHIPPLQLGFLDRVLRWAAKRLLSRSDRLLLRLAGAPPVNDRGTSLDLRAHVMAMLDAQVNGVAFEDMTVAQARINVDRAALLVAKEPPAVQATDHSLTDHVRGRLFRPRGTEDVPTPMLVFVHGGGWSVGSLDSHDPLCRRLAAETGRLVWAIDYRRAPEHPFPGPLDDVLAAWRAILDQAADYGGSVSDVVLAGDSAGGNLVAAACLVLRDTQGPLPHRQLLIYPSTNMHCATSTFDHLAMGPFLTRADVLCSVGYYAPPDFTDARASPLLAKHHGGLPPAIIVTAGFDPLRDDGEDYVAALESAGVQVVHIHAANLVHGFMNMDGALPEADLYVSRIIDVLQTG